MPPLYEVLFLFSSAQGYLVEIKRLDLPADAPKSSIYQWLWLQGRSVATLRFVNMTTEPHQQRTFEEGQLWFDSQQGEMQFANGRTCQLSPVKDKALSGPLVTLVNMHLS